MAPPLLVQLFIIFYGGPQVGLTLEPMTAGILGLGLNAGAYISEIFRGAIQSIPEGRWRQRARWGWATGWPCAASSGRRHCATPCPRSGSFAALVKDTSLASVITVHELLLTTQQRISFRASRLSFT